MINKNAIPLSWKKIEKIIDDVTINIKKEEVPDIIIAIQRGGFVPAVMLSHALRIREIIPIDIRVTQDDSINSPKVKPVLVHNPVVEKIKGKKVLLVDDIVGSGFTYQATIDYLKGYLPASITSFVCVVNKDNWEKNNKDSFDRYIDNVGMEVRGWVKFPWERA